MDDDDEDDRLGEFHDDSDDDDDAPHISRSGMGRTFRMEVLD